MNRTRGWGRVGLRTIVGLLLVAAIGVVSLYTAGSPPFVTRRLLKALEPLGLVVRVEALRLRFPLVIEAHGVRIYARTVAEGPVIEAEAADVPLRLSGARQSGNVRGLRLRGGRVKLAPPAEIDAPVLENLAADIEFTEGGIRVNYAECRHGAIFQAQGLLTGLGTAGETQGAPRLPTDWDRRLYELARPLQKLQRILRLLEGPTPPRVRLQFMVPLSDPNRAQIEVQIQGKDAQPRALPPMHWRARLTMQPDAWHLIHAEAAWIRGRLMAEGLFRPSSQTFEGRMIGDMPLADWMKLPVPEELQRAWGLGLRASRLRIEWESRSPLALSSAASGRLHGRLTAQEAEILEMPLPHFSGTFEWEEGRLRVENIQAEVGSGAQRGPVEGWFAWDSRTGRWEGRLKTGFDPAVLMPILTARQAAAVAAVVFPKTPPRCEAEFAGRIGQDEALWIRGRVEGDRFLFNGSAVRRAEADFELANDVLRLSNVIVERDEGRLTGRMVERLRMQEVEFEAESTLHPPALARMISPFTHRLIQQFRFEGPVRIAGQGIATYQEREDHAFVLDVEGERMGWRLFIADRLAFRLEANGKHVIFKNIRGVWHGGSVSGTLHIALSGERHVPDEFQADVSITDVDLAAILQDATDSDASEITGRVTLRGQFRGTLVDDLASKIEGRGSIRIRDGRLLKIPLFGGLSRVLTQVAPGVGFAVQDEFRADFTIGNGVCQSENIRMRGPTLSLHARGRYDLKADDVQLVARVQLLRSGIVADTLRVLTFPISRLLEFDVRGPASAPVWRARNLPDF